MIAIIDDDSNFVNQFKTEMTKYHIFAHELIKEYNCDFEHINFDLYQIVFIDIMLLETDGLTLAKQIKNKDIKIIFMSNHNSLVYDCFDMNLYFFIRKEFYQDDLKRLVKKLNKESNENAKQYLVNAKDHIYIFYHDIMFIQSQRNQCTFHTVNQNYKQYITLKKCESIFCINSAFYKINSYTIINFRYVKKINTRNITLSNGMIFNVSRQCKDIVEKYHIFRREHL